jgi:hypothetical protein
MNIANRLYAYPVLSEETDDYIDRFFTAEMDRTLSGVEEMEFDFTFNTDSETIGKLIETKYAEYMIHVECSQTAYRRAHRSRANIISFEIPLKKVSGKVEFVAFVVLRKDIKGFSSKEWSEDFDGLTFDLPKGTILAYQNMDSLTITKDFEEFTNPNSIISVVKIHSAEQIPAEVNLEADHIQIRMYEKDYDEYFRMSNNLETQELVNASTVLPALVYAFEELKNEDTYEKFSTRNWLMSLEKAYAARGQDFKDVILNSEKSGYVLAQEVMDMPVSKIYTGINQLRLPEGGEEE